jgi:hypothetical protein
MRKISITFLLTLFALTAWADVKAPPSATVGGGVTQIDAGTGCSITPTNGLGIVTINCPGNAYTGTAPIVITGTVISVNDGTSSAPGVLQGDGSTVTIVSGVISCTTATPTQIGCGEPDNVTLQETAGVWSIKSLGSLSTTGNAATATNFSGTPTVPNGTAATTQSCSDSTTKLATDGYVTNCFQPAISSTLPTVTTVNGNAPANNASTGFTFTSAYSGTPTAVLNGTALTWAPAEAVTLTNSGGGLPAGFSTSTTYYVNTTGLSTTTFQLCSSPPTFAGNAWTACTSIQATSAGSGTQTASASAAGNYLAYGNNANSFFVVMPYGTYSGATGLKFTFPSATHGYVCSGVDMASVTSLLQSNGTVSTCNITKAAAAAALDVIAVTTQGPT